VRARVRTRLTRHAALALLAQAVCEGHSAGSNNIFLLQKRRDVAEEEEPAAAPPPPPPRRAAATLTASSMPLKGGALQTGVELVGRPRKRLPLPPPPRPLPPPVVIKRTPLAVAHQHVLAKYPSLRDVRVNPAVVRGAPLFTRFTSAVAAAGAASRVRLLLHGTAEENIDSILTSGLRGGAGNLRWFTSCLDVASVYARDAQRIIIFAVLRPTPCSSFPGKAYTIDIDAHHVPLFVARRW
jgi:hypothetical protein